MNKFLTILPAFFVLNFFGYNVYAVMTLSETHINTTCGYSNGSIDLIVNGAVPPVTFSWNTGATTEDLTNISSGMYSVLAVDATFQTATLNITVSGTPGPHLAFTHNDDVCNLSVGSISMTIIGGTAPFNIIWNTGHTTEDLDLIVSGNYNVTVTDGIGCTADSGVVVLNGTNIVLTETHVNANGGNNGSIDITATGGSGGYSYQWNNGSTTEDLNGLAAGTYSVTVSDGVGCVNTISVDISFSSGTNNYFPAINNLTVTTSADGNEFEIKGATIKQISVFNITGQLMLCKQFFQSSVQITSNSFAPGLYFINVESSEGEHQLKYVKY